MIYRSLLGTFLVCSMLGLSARAQLVEEQPNYAKIKIKADKNLPLYKDFHAEKMTYWKARLEQYEKLTSDPPQIREQTKDYLAEALSYIFSPLHYQGEKELVARSDKLIKAGAVDPLFVLVTARLQHLVTTNHLPTHNMLNKNEAPLRAAKYGTEILLLNRLWQDASFPLNKVRCAENNASTKNNPKFPELLDLTEQWLQTEGTHKANQRIIWEVVTQIISILHPEDRAELYDRYNKMKGLDPWLKAMMTGSLHLKFAWYHRGGGYAHTVTEEGWKRFRHHISAAKIAFQQAIATNPKLPDPYAFMISASMADSEDPTREMRLWFDKTVEREFDHHSAYSNYFFGLYPRWHGNHARLFDLAKQCALTARFDTYVPLLGRSYLYKIANDNPKINVWKNSGVFDVSKQILTGFIQQPLSNSPTQYWVPNRNLCAHMLFMDSNKAGNNNGMRLGLDVLGGIPHPQCDAEIDPLVMYYASIYAKDSPEKDKVKFIRKFWDDPNSDYSAQNLEKILKVMQTVQKDKLHPKAAMYFDFVELMLKLHSDFDRGEWIDLPFDSEGMRWTPVLGRWKRLSENAYVGDSLEQQKGLRLICQPKFITPYEIEFTMIPKFSNTDKSARSRRTTKAVNLSKKSKNEPGIIFGSLEKPTGKDRVHVHINSENILGINAYSESGIEGNSDSRELRNIQQNPPNTAKRLKVRVYSQMIESYLGGQLVSRVRVNNLHYRPQITFGTMDNLPFEGPVEFHNVRIRKLPRDAPTNQTSNDEFVEYYTKRIKEEPNEKALNFWKGYYLLESDRVREALVEFGRADGNLPYKDDIRFYKAFAQYRLGEYRQSAHLFMVLLSYIFPKNQPLHLYARALVVCPSKEFRNPGRGLAFAKAACNRDEYKTHIYVDTLAAAHAANGDFKAAITREKEAIELYKKNESDEPTEYLQRLALYESGKPYYEYYDKNGKRIQEKDDVKPANK